MYFMLVEILREQPEYKLSVNKYIWSTLAMQMQVDAKRLEEIITDCCTEFAENGSTLLVNDGEYLYSASLLRRMGKVDDHLQPAERGSPETLGKSALQG